MRSLTAFSFLGLVAVVVLWISSTPSEARFVELSYDLSIDLKTGITLPCTCDGIPKAGSLAGDGRTGVAVSVKNNPANNPLNYRYSVTGGRILGQGPNVVWDFNDNSAP